MKALPLRLRERCSNRTEAGAETVSRRAKQTATTTWSSRARLSLGTTSVAPDKPVRRQFRFPNERR